MYKYDVCIIAFVDIDTDARTLNIAKTYAKNGFSVVVVGLGDKDDIIKDDANGIHFYKISVKKFDRTWQRWLDFYRKSTIEINEMPAKLVIAEDVYSLPMANEASKFHKAKMIYDSREIYSQIGPLAGKKIKQQVIKLMEKRYIKRVETIIVTAERDADYLKEHLSDKIPYITVKNYPPYKEKIHSGSIRKQLNIPDNKKIVLYQGMLLKGRGIEKTIDAVAMLDDIVFLILGDGPLKKSLTEYVNTNNLKEKILMPGSIPYEDLHKWTCQADVGVSLIEPISISYKHALPNKIFEYTMARIPSLCTDLPAQKDVIDKYNNGIYVSHTAKSSEIAEAISLLITNKEKYAENCERASHTLNFENQEELLLQLIK